jgi:hypothetical protein
MAGANEAAMPYVRVFVPVSVDQLTGVWPIATSSEAGAWFHKDGTTYEVAESGYMIVTSVDSDYTVTGSVDIRFPNAGQIKTVFRAKIRPNVALCA